MIIKHICFFKRYCFRTACLILLIFPVSVFSQDGNIESALRNLKANRIDEVKIALPELEQRFGAKPEILYLKGIIEEDADIAYQYYREIVEKYYNTNLSEEVLWRIGQYNYAKGLYEPAGVYFRKIIELNKNSEIAEMAKKYLVILEMRFGEEMFNPNKANIGRPRYVIQLSAFANRNNAERLANYLKELKYQNVTINQKTITGRVFYRVWVGEYASREEAKEAGDKIRNLYRFDYRIEEKK